jgi:ornithine cyclodeaminase
MKLFTREEVSSLLEPDALIEAVAAALADVSAGRASVPQRIAAFSPAGLLGAMAAYVPSLDTLAAKLVSLFPENRDRPTHQALIAVFDPRTGTPTAVMDGTEVTAQRTAAASALAVRLLAREDAQVLAILGTGVQARSHARYVPRVRGFREILIAGRDAAKAEEIARQIPGARAAGIEEAVRAADVICAATHSPEPIVRDDWVRPGAHVGSVGVNREGSELEPALFDRALIAVEARAAAFAPFPAGASELRGRDPAAAVELGELVAKGREGRSSAGQITLYKSVGIAAEDAAAAALVLRRGAGREVGI